VLRLVVECLGFASSSEEAGVTKGCEVLEHLTGEELCRVDVREICSQCMNYEVLSNLWLNILLIILLNSLYAFLFTVDCWEPQMGSVQIQIQFLMDKVSVLSWLI
jgi:hypothetical protein